MKGIQFVIDENGEKKAVLINLRQHKRLWEDFYDTMLARERESEPRESLEEVRRKIFGKEAV